MLKRMMLALALAGALAGCTDNSEAELRHQTALKNALNDENRVAGEAFLRENSARPGVQQLPGGVQYKVLSQGHGASPAAVDTVVVHYEGKLVDGTVFDSTWGSDKPARFQVNRVIRGWTRALTQMQVGDEWMLYIPADLAYGARSPSEQIPPNSTLVFRVKLLDVIASEE